MVMPLIGQPNFVGGLIRIARLIPMLSLKVDCLFDQIMQSMKIIHDSTGIVYLQSWTKYLEQNRETCKTGQSKKSLISSFTFF